MNNFSNTNINNTSIKDLIKKFKSKPIVAQLIIINVAIWILLSLISVLCFLFQDPESSSYTWTEQILKYFAVPASLSALSARPWTILTYMFVHTSFWHLLFNMLWLYWFGKIFLEFKSKKELLLLYFAGGFIGSFFFIAAYNIFPVFKPIIDNANAIGASAAILGITIATATIAPNYNIRLLLIGNIKLKHIAIFTVVLDVLMIKEGNAGGHFAHLGGALCGFIYGLWIRNKAGIVNHFRQKKRKRNFSTPKKKKKKKSENIYTETYVSDEDYNRKKHENQEKIDKILDKISEKGYNALSKEEKDFLFSNSSKNG